MFQACLVEVEGQICTSEAGREGTAEIKGAIFVQKNVQFSSAAGPLVQ